MCFKTVRYLSLSLDTKCKTIITQTTYVYKSISRLFTCTCITLLQYLQCFLVVTIGTVCVLLDLLTHQ